MYHTEEQSGFTVIEILIGLAILSIVSTSIYFSYSNVLEIVQTTTYNNAALSIMESRIETARNMRYEDVGVVNGVPSGKLQQLETVTLGGTEFELRSYVRNIDDPFDGTVGGSPNDTSPADYKLVEFQITCDTCTRYKLLTMATYVAPKNLESESHNGNLFVRVLDASGLPVSSATVHVTNANVIPPIDLTDITNGDGLLQMIDIATSSTGYHVEVTKSGYSSDESRPDALVATQQLTITTLFIDRVGSLTIDAKDQYCAPTGGFDFLMTGGKLVSTEPDVPKYSEALVTSTGGSFTNPAVEWDTYTIRPTDTAFDVAGTQSSLSFTMTPGGSQTFTWMTAPRSQDALSVSVIDQNGQPLNDALVHITGATYDRVRVTGNGTIAQSDWSNGQYTDTSPNIDTTAAGMLSLRSSDGVYASGSAEWLISETYDLGTTGTVFTALEWAPTAQPSETGPDALRFQLAANNDNATWNWFGPDGTAATYFTDSGQTVPAALNGNRYLRYRAYISTQDESYTPVLEDISVRFSSGCVMSGQAYFNGLSAGTYTVNVSRAGFQTSNSTHDIADPWQRAVIQLSP